MLTLDPNGHLTYTPSFEESVSPAGRSLMDDVNPMAQRSTLGLGTVATLDFDTDNTLAANSDTKISSQKAVKAYVNTAISNVSITAETLLGSTLAPNITGSSLTSVGTLGSLTVSGVISGSNLSGTNTGNQTITLTGDVTGSGTAGITSTLANTSVTPGSYTSASVTVDSKGRITAASSGLPALDLVSYTYFGGL